MSESPLVVAMEAAIEAGALVEAMRADGVRAREKHDASPVTEADEAADALIRERLLTAFPGDGWISEESATAHASGADDAVWIVDPIDGTEAYVDGSTRGYAVQIARAVAGRLVLGVVYEPREQLLLYALRGQGAYIRHGAAPIERLAVKAAARGGPLRFIASPRTEGATLAALEAGGLVLAGFARSVGVKVGMLVRGEAEAYPATHRVSLWDVAAPLIVLEEAGGAMTDLDGQPLALPFAPPYAIGRDLLATRAAPGIHASLCALLRRVATIGNPAS